MTQIGSVFLDYYTFIHPGFDIDGDGKIQDNEIIDKDGDKKIDIDEYHAFIEANATQFSHQVLNKILSETEGTATALHNQLTLINDMAAMVDDPAEVTSEVEEILQRNPLAWARYLIEKEDPKNISEFSARPDPVAAAESTKQYFEGLFVRLIRYIPPVEVRDLSSDPLPDDITFGTRDKKDVPNYDKLAEYINLYRVFDTPNQQERSAIHSVSGRLASNSDAFLLYPEFFGKTAQTRPSDEAVAFLEDFISKYPEVSYLPTLQLVLVHFYLRRDEYDKAFALCQSISFTQSESDLNDFFLQVENSSDWLRRKLNANKEKEAACSEWTDIIFTRHRSTSFVPLAAGILLETMGQQKKADEQYDRFKDTFVPPNLALSNATVRELSFGALPAFLAIIGDYYYENQRYAEASEAYNLSLEHLPASAAFEDRQDLENYIAGRWQLPLSKLKGQINRTKNIVGKRYLRIAETYLELGETKKAKAALDEIIGGSFGVYDEAKVLKAKVLMQEGNYFEAYTLLRGYLGHRWGIQEKDRLFLMGICILLAVDNNQWQESDYSAHERERTADPCKYALDVFRDIASIDDTSLFSQDYMLAIQAALINDALERGETLQLETVCERPEFVIKKFRGVNGLSLIFYPGVPLPEIIPGDVRAEEIDSELVVTANKYFGKQTVIFKKPQSTIPTNNNALLLAYRILPNEFFDSFRTLVFTGEDEELDGIYLENNSIMVHQSDKPLRVIVHELAHHWDLKVTLGSDGRHLGLGDLSLIYYGISWTPAKISREISSREFGKVEWDRSDFDNTDFARSYGMCNRKEDLATMVEAYVTDGANLRTLIHQQMEQGNFELAVKYLFVKHLMPFAGREYEKKLIANHTQQGRIRVLGTKEESGLTLDEVAEKMRTWSTDHPDSIEPATREAFQKIKRKCEESKYK
ncbi:MAG: hypothetical protein HQ596_07700 [Candidatus Saganbacteria bacterium]|nr:hypothetical protein [Candidatus Saganbacteria bacterium]